MDKDTMITPAAICSLIKACETDDNISLISFALIQNGKVLAKFCKEPYREDFKRLLFSMTKSFTSMAVGIAIDKGLLSLDDYVVSFFSEELPERPHPNLLKMKIRHLLTMTTGIHDNTYPELFPQSNWVKAFLAQDFLHEPGTYYRYSTHASHMLSAIIQKVSTTSLENFLNDSLFSCMDITEVEWEHSPEGLTAGGMGLSLCPASLMKVACMLLNKGVYKEKRIVSEEYIALATSPQIIKQDDVNSTDQHFSGYQYGFQFHISPNGSYRADGAFGQFCIIHPQSNSALIATSQKTSTERFLTLVDKYIIKGEGSNSSISQIQMEAYLSRLAFPIPEHSSRIDNLLHGVYAFEDNELNIGKILFTDNRIELFLINGTQDLIDIAYNEYVYGKSHFIKDLQIHLQEHCAFATWLADSSLLLTIYYIETPYVGKYKFQFLDKKVIFTFSVNVSMTLKGFKIEGTKVAKSK